MSALIGVDVGGTFTDLVAWSAGSAPVAVKIPSTPGDPAAAVLDAIARAVAGDSSEVSEVLHGTTVGTNAVLERKGARTALVATAGFRDVLELGRRTRPQIYGLRGFYRPHVPRWHRYEVTERVDAGGRPVTPISRDQVAELARRFEKEGIESIAVSLLHAYAYPDHEHAVREVFAELLPDVPVTLSSDVLPEIREFERTVASVVNAYIRPTTARYLSSLSKRLNDVAPAAHLNVMQGNGGLVPVADIADFPVRTVLSGPAAGVHGALHVAREAGISDCITCDMGGTSFDVGLIEDARPVATTALHVEYNVPLRIPALDIHTIGAGGGSIAWLDRGGLLRVGPQSAGAVPGPILYGRGGTKLTVTDANVLAGRLRPPALGTESGRLKTAEEIWNTLERHEPELVQTFGTPKTLADAVLRVVNSAMAGAVREITIRRGREPARFVLVAYGGAGPLHAVDVARELGIAKVLVPNAPGLLSAFGCLKADYAIDAVRTIRGRLQVLDESQLRAAVGQLMDEVATALKRYPAASPSVRALFECQFEGQSHSLYVESPLQVGGASIEAAFRKSYVGRYGSFTPTAPVVLRSIRVEGRAARPDADDLSLTHIWKRRIAGPTDPASYWRPTLAEGMVIDGQPSIVDAPDASVYLPHESCATVVRGGHLLVETGC